MGMIGNVGKQFLNVVGRDFLGVDFEREAARQQKADQQKAVFAQLLAGLKGQPAQYQDGPPVDVAAPPSLADQAAPPGIDDLSKLLSNGGRPAPPVQPPAPYAYQPPKMTAPAVAPLDANSPQLPGLALAADASGLKVPSFLDILKAQQPNVQFDRGFGYNRNTGASMGGYHPDLDKGQTLGPDGSVANLPGAVQAAAQMAGGVEGAKANAQAPYQAVQTFDSTGRPMTINALTLAGGADGKGAPFVGQSPAMTAADTARATAGASADINLPQTLANAHQAISLIEQMKSHSGLDSRTGWRGLLPALPDSPGAGFQAMQEQLTGKVFLQAYDTLKGAGQITEVEGQKAQQAIARLNNKQSKADYLAALNDLESVIDTGAQRASGQATRLQPNGGGAQRSSSTPVRSTGPAMAGKGYRILSVE